MTKLVFGVGINDGKYPSKVSGKTLKEKNLWVAMLSRCYREQSLCLYPNYRGCSVSENFKNYSYFYEWCQSQIGFGQKVFALDKDCLLKGNKVYSEDTCVFLPRALNNLTTLRGEDRGNYPIGVCASGDKFLVQCLRKPASRFVGYFNTPEEAFSAYKQAKETYIKLQAEKWKAHIDPRAFTALMAYEVLPTD